MTNELVIAMDDREAVTSSRTVAEVFNKEHKNVLASIRDILAAENSATKFFHESTYENRGKQYIEYLMNRDGLSLLVMGFTGQKAMEWKFKYIEAFNAMEQVIREHSLEGQVRQVLGYQLSLEKKLRESGILKEYIAPHHFFDHLTARWKEVTKKEKVRDFYDAIGLWAGVQVPYSHTINITVKQWLLNHVGLEVIEEFVVGLETGMIVYSYCGQPVSKHGVFGNSVEWNKILREFDNKCAYCGSKESLIAEHVIPQSVLSKTHPESVDLIGNIVPACQHCNGLKKTQDLEEWYSKQSFHSKQRLVKIKRHQNKYEVNEVG